MLIALLKHSNPTINIPKGHVLFYTCSRATQPNKHLDLNVVHIFFSHLKMYILSCSRFWFGKIHTNQRIKNFQMDCFISIKKYLDASRIISYQLSEKCYMDWLVILQFSYRKVMHMLRTLTYISRILRRKKREKSWPRILW